MKLKRTIHAGRIYRPKSMAKARSNPFGFADRAVKHVEGDGNVDEMNVYFNVSTCREVLPCHPVMLKHFLKWAGDDVTDLYSPVEYKKMFLR